MLPFLSSVCPPSQWEWMATTSRPSPLNSMNPHFLTVILPSLCPLLGLPLLTLQMQRPLSTQDRDFFSLWGNSRMLMALNTSCINYCSDIHGSSLSAEPQVNTNRYFKRITPESRLSCLDPLLPQQLPLGSSDSLRQLFVV